MATASSTNATAGALRSQLEQAWRDRAPRERRLLLVAATAVALLVLWMIAVRPAMQVVRQAPGQLAVLDTQLQQMQRLAAESQGLRSATPVAPSAAAAALRSATERLGPTARLQMQGDRATLNFEDIPAPRLIAWLAEARTGARARAADAQFTRSNQGYSGSVVLLLGPGS